MAEEPIIIPVRVTGAAKAQRDLEGLGKKGQQAAGGIDRLSSSLAKFASLEAARRVFNLGRSYQNLERRVLAVSVGSQDLAANMQLVTNISRDTRSDIETNAKAFQRLKIATESLGLTSQQVGQILRTINQGFAIGGSEASEARSSILQLTQALGADQLGGEELRALRENAAILSRSLAKELGVKGVGALKQLGADGKLNAKILTDALLRAADDTDKAFGKLPKTFDDAVTGMNNSLIRFGSAIIPIVQNVATSIDNITTSIEMAAEAADRFAARRQRFLALEGFADKDAERGKRIQQLLKEAQAFRAQLDALRGDPNSDPAQRAQILVVLGGIERELLSVQEEARKAQAQLDGVLDTADKRSNRAGEAAAARENPFDFQLLPPTIPGASAGAEPLIGNDNQIESMKRFSQMAIDELDRVSESSQLLEDSLTSVFTSATDSLITLVETGKFEFDEFASSVLGDLARILQQALVTQAVAALLGPSTTPLRPGSFGIAGFPGLAAGGPVSAGEDYIVGERGPERFRPTTSGRIEPNGAGGGGAGPINLTVVNQIGREEFVKVIDDRLDSPAGAAKTIAGLSRKKTQAKNLLKG